MIQILRDFVFKSFETLNFILNSLVILNTKRNGKKEKKRMDRGKEAQEEKDKLCASINVIFSS